MSLRGPAMESLVGRFPGGSTATAPGGEVGEPDTLD